MTAERQITFEDITQAVENRDPQLADRVVSYLEQPDPPENVPEDHQPAPGQPDEAPPLAADAWTLARARGVLAPDALAHKAASERKAARREAWQSLLAAPHSPPRLRLGALLLSLYESGEETAQAALLDIFRRARVGWGIWQAMKKIYKLAEERHDAAMFGVLAQRFDTMRSTPTTGEVSTATFVYMQRRAWRYLRHLGVAVPELFPQFAAQVLRCYPQGAGFSGCWVANHIWGQKELLGKARLSISGPPRSLSKRAFDEAWKLSSEPLLRLLEDATNDTVCDFAIRSLVQDFPAVLRQVDPRWLDRLGRKPLSSVHEFVVKLLGDSPEFHQSKLRGLGLHEMVLGLLMSESASARAYAVAYARAHAADLSLPELVRLASQGKSEAQAFAIERLQGLAPRQIGLPALVELLGVGAAAKLAQQKIEEGFAPGDLDAELYIRLACGHGAQPKLAVTFFQAAKQKVPAPHLCALLDDRRCTWSARRAAIEELGKRGAAEIGLAWIQKALFDPQIGSMVTRWLSGGMLRGSVVDPEWLKGLVMRPALRPLAIELLSDRQLIRPGQIGLGWLLAMTRQPDKALSEFAQRYLLEHFTPEDFALEAGGTDLSAGIDKLWALAAGPREPEAVRAFASLYLRVHHPELGPTLPEARSLGIKPRLPTEAYGLARLRPLFFDGRPDVRRLAVAIGQRELVRWGDVALVYALADSAHREPRGLASDALLGIGQEGADAKLTPPLDWVKGGPIFALAESPVKAARELGLTLIRRHYERIADAARLAWLMESPDREVRLFAVRLLWERHRPRDVGAWTPARGSRPAELPEGAQRFPSAEAMRLFLRTVLFGLPPGRMERREAAPGEAQPDRPLPASAAKHRLLEVIGEMACADRGFAELAVPVLEEFLHSEAKGEWQGCLTALARVRRSSPGLVNALPVPTDIRSRGKVGPDRRDAEKADHPLS